MRGKTKKLLAAFFAVICVALAAAGAADAATSSGIYVLEGEYPTAPAYTSYEYDAANAENENGA